MNVLFTVADKNNLKYAKQLENSVRKFHSKDELDFILFTEEDVGDKLNFYRQKPMFASRLIDKYDLVIGADADQICTGDLTYLFEKEYDVGVVLNYNRVDPAKYGQIGILDITPTEYMNCGLVAMRSKQFIDHWWSLCNSNHFFNLRYREQDLLNILVHYGNYEVVCFDFPDKTRNYSAWHGLIAKGEYNKMIIQDNKLILPKAKDNYPEADKEIKMLHSAGGGNEQKIGDAYRLYFNEEVIKYIDKLVK